MKMIYILDYSFSSATTLKVLILIIMVLDTLYSF